MSEEKKHRYGGVSSSAVYQLIPQGSIPMTEEDLKAQAERNAKIAADVKAIKETIKAAETEEEKAAAQRNLEDYQARNKRTNKTTKEGGFAAPGLTYIEDKIMERELGRALDKDHSAKPTSWGSLVEGYVFEQINENFDYDYIEDTPDNRLLHPEFGPAWTGIPDLIRFDEVVGDIKCPWSMKDFVKLVRCMADPLLFKQQKPEYYWQLVSNSILTGLNRAELIVFMPDRHDLIEIKKRALLHDGPDQYKYWGIYASTDRELPHLTGREVDKYKRINKLEFPIDPKDQAFLTERVRDALKIIDNATR